MRKTNYIFPSDNVIWQYKVGAESEREWIYYAVFASLFSCLVSGITYTLSKSGRPAIFARDPDANALEFTQVDKWSLFQVINFAIYILNGCNVSIILFRHQRDLYIILYK